MFLAEAPSLGGPPLTDGATVKLPGGATRTLALVGDNYRFSATADTPAALADTYPAGSYELQIASSLVPFTPVTAMLPEDSFPPAPEVLNYVAAQSIAAAEDFTLNLAALSGATDDENVTFRILDGGSEVMFDTIPAMSTEWMLPADSLAGGKSYQLEIRYGRYTTDLEALPPMASGFFSETRLTITTSGGTPVDTTPPLLVMSVPAAGATGVLRLLPVTFAFSEAMDTAKVAVQWSAGLDPAKFTYQWQAGGEVILCTYAGSLPVGTHTWTLNATPGGANSFRDVAGNLLPMTTGSFTTEGSSGGCEGETPVESAGFSLFKQLAYVQTGSGTPEPKSPAGALFLGVYGTFSAGGGTGPNVTIEFPAPPAPAPHTVKAFNSFPGGLAFLMEEFADQAQLDAAYPNADFAVQLRDLSQPPASQVTNSAVLVFGAGAYPPTPHFTNFDEAQAVNPTNDFTLRWDAFTGVGSADFITLEIVSSEGEIVFSAPDACAGRLLPNTATSIVIPAGTMAAGKTYTAKLSFLRLTDQGKVLAGKTGVAGVGKTTETTLKTTGGIVVTAPRFVSMQSLPGAQVELTIELTAGRSFVLLSGLSPAEITTLVVMTNPPASPLKLTVPTALLQQYFRGRTD